MTSIDVSGAAAAAEKAVENVMKVEPYAASVAGMFVPGAAPIVAAVQPWILMVAPYLERALTDIAQGNGGDILNAIPELLQHVSKGQPNSSVLTPAVTPG